MGVGFGHIFCEEGGRFGLLMGERCGGRGRGTEEVELVSFFRGGKFRARACQNSQHGYSTPHQTSGCDSHV